MKCYYYGLIGIFLVFVISCVFLVIFEVVSFCGKEKVFVLIYWIVLNVFFVVIMKKIDSGFIRWYLKDIELICLE